MARELALATVGAQDTRRLAGTIAGALRADDVVSLTGELGAGKTCFVQGAAAGLGVTQRVTSPTFLLRRDYQGRLPVIHLDVYRLDSLQEALELGMEEARGAVTFIEWGDAMRPLLPAAHLEVELRTPQELTAAADGDTRRLITLRPYGADWNRRIVGLAVDCAPWRVDGGPSQLVSWRL